VKFPLIDPEQLWDITSGNRVVKILHPCKRSAAHNFSRFFLHQAGEAMAWSG
jgi:hypothetical protein